MCAFTKSLIHYKGSILCAIARVPGGYADSVGSGAFVGGGGYVNLTDLVQYSCIDLPDGTTHSFGAGYVHEAKASIAKHLVIPIQNQILTVGERVLSNST